jgi:S1-C subfamily serine protease
MLFLGYSIDPPLTTLDPTQVVFRFSYRQNQTVSDLPTFQGMGGVGSGGTPSELITVTGGKLGHQYLWALQGESSDGSSLQRRVKGVYVSTVYPSGNFALLGLNAGLVVTNAATPSGS